MLLLAAGVALLIVVNGSKGALAAASIGGLLLLAPIVVPSLRVRWRTLPGLIAQERADIAARNRARFETKRDAGMDYWCLENGGRFWITPEEVAERRAGGAKYTKAMIKWQTPDKAYALEALEEAPAEEIERMLDGGKAIVLFEV